MCQLKELLIEDMNKYIDNTQTTVLAKETIILIKDIYNTKKLLRNAQIIHATEVLNILKILSNKKATNHYQFIVETGERSPRNQGEPGQIHYSAMDVYCEDDGQLLVVIADHYFGKNYISYKKEYEELTDPLIHFIILGGKDLQYQSDSRHCPIFSLQHLLLTAQDPSLKEFYKQAIPDETDVTSEPAVSNESAIPNAQAVPNLNVKFISWYSLPHEYFVCMQSMNNLFTYADKCRQSEHRTQDEGSAILIEANFDKLVSNHLKPNPQRNMRIQNFRIEAIKERIMNETITEIENISEQQLIQICYGDNKVISEILKRETNVSSSAAVSIATTENYVHPLLSLVFSNQPLINCLSLKTLSTLSKKSKPSDSQKLIELLIEPSLLYLISKGLIDAQLLFLQITDTENIIRAITTSKLKLLTQHIQVMEAIAKFIENTHCIHEYMGNNNNILELLLHKNAKILLKNPQIIKYYCTGRINNDTIFSLRTDKLTKITDDCAFNDEQIFTTLLSCCIEASPLSIATCLSPITADTLRSPRFFDVSRELFPAVNATVDNDEEDTMAQLFNIHA